MSDLESELAKTAKKIYKKMPTSSTMTWEQLGLPYQSNFQLMVLHAMSFAIEEIDNAGRSADYAGQPTQGYQHAAKRLRDMCDPRIKR